MATVRIPAPLPEVALELVASGATDRSLFREAHIAARMFRADQPDVATKHPVDLRRGLSGAVSYLGPVVS